MKLSTFSIPPGKHGLFRFVVCLFFDNRSEDAYLYWCQSQRSGFLGTAFVPELCVLLYHSFEEIIERYVPIHLIRVGYEKCRNRFGGVTDRCQVVGIVQLGGYLRRVYH